MNAAAKRQTKEGEANNQPNHQQHSEQPINQQSEATNRPTNQATNQPTSQPTYQLTKQPINKATSQSADLEATSLAACSQPFGSTAGSASLRRLDKQWRAAPERISQSVGSGSHIATLLNRTNANAENETTHSKTR